MKTTVLLIALFLTTYSNLNAKPNSANAIAFYTVPLVCPAAPDIGCGTKSKPILLDLEKERKTSPRHGWVAPERS